MNGFGQSTVRRKKGKKLPPTISFPEDFRPVSAIIDVDILPETLRRVRLHKHGSNKPLGKENFTFIFIATMHWYFRHFIC